MSQAANVPPETLRERLRRLTGTLQGALLGCVLAVVAVPLILWNESGTIVNVQSDALLADSIVSVVTDPVQTVNEGRLVHMTGPLMVPVLLTDPDLGLTFQAVKVQRRVEMYQWQETVTLGRPTLAHRWSDELIDSSRFQQKPPKANPSAMPYVSRDWQASQVRLGAFTLPTEMIDRDNAFEDYVVTSETLQRLDEKVRSKAHIADHWLFLGKDPAAPQPGDVRIRYAIVRPGVVSIVGKQSSATFEPFYTKSGRRLLTLWPGPHLAETMYNSLTAGSPIYFSTLLTWLFRLIALGLLTGGLALICTSTPWLARVPVVKSWLSFGPEAFAAIVGLSLWFLLIGFAWLSYSLWFSLLMMAIGGGILYGTYYSAEKKKAKP